MMSLEQAQQILDVFDGCTVPDALLDAVLEPAITRRDALHLAQRLIDGGWVRFHLQSQLRNLARFIQRNAQ